MGKVQLGEERKRLGKKDTKARRQERTRKRKSGFGKKDTEAQRWEKRRKKEINS
jgi:hypothetical protein